jgi:transketolase C-terminal domain/subunit
MSVEMRAVLANKLKEMMTEDKKVVVLDADLAKAAAHGLRNGFSGRAMT